MALRVTIFLAVTAILIGALSVWLVPRFTSDAPEDAARIAAVAPATPQDVGNKWTEENSGALNNEMADFIIARTGSDIDRHVRDRISDAVTWEYVADPVESGAGAYNVTARASVRLESVPLPPLLDHNHEPVNEVQREGYVALDVAYHLAISADAVTDWRADFDEAAFNTDLPALVGSRAEAVQALQARGMEQPLAECVVAAIYDEDVPEDAMATLRAHRVSDESMRLNAALSERGVIMDDCKPYLENNAG